MLIIEVTPEEMRNMIRISHAKLDDELELLKEAFLMDLLIAGVHRIPKGDALSLAALRLYLRWQTNFNSEAERYHMSYESVKIAMTLAGEYQGGENAE